MCTVQPSGNIGKYWPKHTIYIPPGPRGKKMQKKLSLGRNWITWTSSKQMVFTGKRLSCLWTPSSETLEIVDRMTLGFGFISSITAEMLAWSISSRERKGMFQVWQTFTRAVTLASITLLACCNCCWMDTSGGMTRDTSPKRTVISFYHLIILVLVLWVG